MARRWLAAFWYGLGWLGYGWGFAFVPPPVDGHGRT
jgi:hypothetical protein